MRLDIKIEHLDELGDLTVKHLIIEIMGKHSNIILCDENYIIVDSIKHISGFVSSVREVLPGRSYFIPQTVEKVRALKAMIERKNLSTIIEVDGGVNLQTGQELISAGADALVAGNFVFKSENPLETIAELKKLRK